jgi:hypothetical protein
VSAAFGIDSGSDSFVGTAKGLGSCDISLASDAPSSLTAIVDEGLQVNAGSSMGTRPTTSRSLLMGHVSTALVTARMSHMDATLFRGSGVGTHERIVHESKQRRRVVVAEPELRHARRRCAGRDVRVCNGAHKVVEHAHPRHRRVCGKDRPGVSRPMRRDLSVLISHLSLSLTHCTHH